MFCSGLQPYLDEGGLGERIGMGKLLNMKSSLFAGAGLLCCVFGATQTLADTLEDALVAAYNSNPDLRAERANLRSVDENVAQAISGWRATVSVNGSIGLTERVSSPSFGSPSQSLEPLQGSATVTQPVFSGFRTLNSYRQSQAQIRAGRANLTAVEQQTLLSAVTAYIDVWRDTAVVNLNQNNVAVLRKQLEASQDRFSVGEITRTDVAQSEARLSGSISVLITSESQLTNSRATYARIVGNSPGTLEPPPPLPPLPATQEEALSTALVNNPNLVRARNSERASAFAVAVARGNLLPTISFQGQLATAEDTSITGSQSGEKSITGQLSWPFYQGGLVHSQVRQARQLKRQSQALIISAERQTVEGVATAWSSLTSARATIVSDQEQVRANEIAYEGVQREAEVGSRTTLDVLDAEQELLDSRVSLVSSQRNEIIAGYQVLSSVGKLTAQELELPVEAYDPLRNYRSVKWRPFGTWIRKE